MWTQVENGNDITLSNQKITFNDIPRLTHLSDYPRRRLRLFVIIIKEYIYACKCLDKNQNMQEFKRKAIPQWQIEKCALPWVTYFPAKPFFSDLTSQLKQTHQIKAQTLTLFFSTGTVSKFMLYCS